MAHLPEQFDAARSNVEPSDTDKSNAATAHTQVRSALEGDSDLAKSDIDTILIASYARNVSIRRMRDVDVFSQLPGLSQSTSVNEVLNMFQRALEARFAGGRVKRRTRCVEVEFPEFDLRVDAVPARHSGADWEIPDRSEGWIKTAPVRLGELTTAMNERARLGATGAYVPVVKFVRQIRRAQFAKLPAGVYFEILAYWAFDAGISASSWGEYLALALANMTAILEPAVAKGLPDPSLPGETVETKADHSQLQEALSELRDCSQQADEALRDTDDCRAARIWRDLLGENDDGQVFPMPEHCDDEGRSKSARTLTPGFRTVPSGEGKFA